MARILPTDQKQHGGGVPNDAKETGYTWTWMEQIIHFLPSLTFLVHEFCLLMATLYLARCYWAVSLGDDTYKMYGIGAFVFGVVLALLPILGLLMPGIGRIWGNVIICCPDDIGSYLSWVITGCLHVMFLVAMFVLFILMFVTTTELQEVHAALWVQADCSGGHLLEIRELLAYKMKGGSATIAKRSLPNQVEPSNLRVAPVGGQAGPLNPRLMKIKRIEPGKTAFNYESGQITDLNIEFDSFTNPGNSSLQIWLWYTARLEGTSENWHSDGPDSWVNGVGRWTIDRSDLARSSLQLGNCSSNSASQEDATCALTAAPEKNGIEVRLNHVEDQTWDVQIRAPNSLSIGSDVCPLAWSLPERNLFWLIGSLALVSAIFICVVALYAASSSSDGGFLLVACAMSGCCVLIAIVLFALAMFSDLRSK